MGKWVVILHDAKDATDSGRTQLRMALIRALNLSESRASEIINTLPYIVKKDLDRAKAEKFFAVLEDLGALVEILESKSEANEDYYSPPAEELTNQKKEPENCLEFEEQNAETEKVRRSVAIEVIAPELIEEPNTKPSPEAKIECQLKPEPIKEAGIEPSPIIIEETRRPQYKPRKRELILAGIASCLLLFSIGFLSFFGNDEQQKTAIEIDLKKLLKDQKEILNPTTEQPQISRKSYFSEGSVNGLGYKLSLIEINDVIVSASLELNSEEPKRLTKEELARGVKAPVWLKRFESKSVRPVMAQPIDRLIENFELSGLARVYLSDIEGAERVIAHVVVRGKKDADSLVGSWELTRGVDLPLTERIIERVGKTDFRLSLHENWHAELR